MGSRCSTTSPLTSLASQCAVSCSADYLQSQLQSTLSTQVHFTTWPPGAVAYQVYATNQNGTFQFVARAIAASQTQSPPPVTTQVNQTQQQQSSQSGAPSIEEQLAVIQAEANAIAAELASTETSGTASGQTGTNTSTSGGQQSAASSAAGTSTTGSSGSGTGTMTVVGVSISLTQPADVIVIDELLNAGFSQTYASLSGDFFKSLIHNLPPSVAGLVDTGEFKQALIDEFAGQRNSINLNAADLSSLGISVVQSITIDVLKTLIAKKFSPEVAEPLAYVLNVAADTARGAVSGGAPGAYAAFATSVTVNTALELGQTAYAFVQLNNTNSDLQTSMIAQGATYVNLLSAATLNRQTGNTTRANQETSLVNSSLVSYGTQVKDSPTRQSEWSIISLFITAAEEQLNGNLFASNQDIAQANSTAASLNQNLFRTIDYVALANRAAQAYGL